MDDEDYSENSDGSFNSEKDFITLSKKSKRTELSYIDDSSLSGIKSKYKRTRSPPSVISSSLQLKEKSLKRNNLINSKLLSLKTNLLPSIITFLYLKPISKY